MLQRGTCSTPVLTALGAWHLAAFSGLSLVVPVALELQQTGTPLNALPSSPSQMFGLVTLLLFGTAAASLAKGVLEEPGGDGAAQ